jgi:3'-phosphoadenosine 5'-phosphosulfate sulfotransferase (PAPS reductase)/FAD synthetase
VLRAEDREIGRLRARSSAYKKRVAQSLDLIERALEDHAPMYVSFSCGKDSAVMFDLVRQVDPDIEGRFIRWPETQWIDDFDAVLNGWTAKGARVSVLDLSRGSLSESVPDRWLRLRETSPSRGTFIGLRADESYGRRMTLKIHGQLYVAKDEFVRCCPIAWWSDADVAARIVEHDLPILSAYEAGISTRTVARVPRDSVRESFLQEMKDRDYSGYRQILAMYPDI